MRLICLLAVTLLSCASAVPISTGIRYHCVQPPLEFNGATRLTCNYSAVGIACCQYKAPETQTPDGMRWSCELFLCQNSCTANFTANSMTCTTKPAPSSMKGTL